MTATDADPPTVAGDAVGAGDHVAVGEQPVEADGAGFLGLGLDDRLVQALSGLGYEEPTDIQRGRSRASSPAATSSPRRRPERARPRPSPSRWSRPSER